MKTARLDLRIPKELRKLIEKAAEKDQRTVSDFIRILIENVLEKNHGRLN